MTPENQAFLQLTMTPQEYFQAKVIKKEQYDYPERYWQQLPRYVVSRCPLCDAAYTSRIDPHTLMTWQNYNTPMPDTPYFWDEENAEEEVCEHRIATQCFVNLEGLIPSERPEFENCFHVPFISPWLVPDDTSMIAVIHSFAICRIEDEQGNLFDDVDLNFQPPLKTIEAMQTDERDMRQYTLYDGEALLPQLADAIYVPRYTAYSVTYYGLQPDFDMIYEKRMQPQFKSMSREDSPYDLSWLDAMPHKGSIDYDLAHWIQQGKLQWLDLTSPDLPLKSAPVEAFPYTDIQFDWDYDYCIRY